MKNKHRVVSKIMLTSFCLLCLMCLNAEKTSSPEEALNYVDTIVKKKYISTDCLSPEMADFKLLDFTCMAEKIELGLVTPVSEEEARQLGLPTYFDDIQRNWVPAAAFKYKGYIVAYFSIKEKILDYRYNGYLLSTNIHEPELVQVYDSDYKYVMTAKGFGV